MEKKTPIMIFYKLTSPVPNPKTLKPGDWGCHYNAVGHHKPHLPHPTHPNHNF